MSSCRLVYSGKEFKLQIGFQILGSRASFLAAWVCGHPTPQIPYVQSSYGVRVRAWTPAELQASLQTTEDSCPQQSGIITLVVI